MSKNKLLVNMRFMDMALNQFRMSPRPDLTPFSACDGDVYVYDPVHILKAYMLDENLPIRNFLHSVLHCVFKHFYVNTLVDQTMWDLACDIAVESAINDLELSFLNITKAKEQVQFFDLFKNKVKTVSAEKIYRYFLDEKLSEHLVEKLSLLFKGDDHVLWYLTETQKKKMNLYASQGEAVKPLSNMLLLLQGWADIALRMQTELEVFILQGKGAGLLTQNLREVNRERYDYSEFLKKFAVRAEMMKLNPDEFDYNFYTYGLTLYENMPLIEPLEYREVKRIREFVIAIDTSGSTSGSLVQTFVQKTYNILKSTESFFSKINLHIIQCDAEIQEDVKITTQQEFDAYLKQMQLHGLGGTDFRPVFAYVNHLVEKKEFDNLKGLIYFTDGYGSFPQKTPPYDTAFVFVEDEQNPSTSNNYEVPSWAMKLVLRKEEL
ncbi:MAG: metallopeptidase [Lachnospiraceae bacterium]|nr:metallopeptidase [Lachnospiraceae bacterium]